MCNFWKKVSRLWCSCVREKTFGQISLIRSTDPHPNRPINSPITGWKGSSIHQFWDSGHWFGNAVRFVSKELENFLFVAKNYKTFGIWTHGDWLLRALCRWRSEMSRSFRVAFQKTCHSCFHLWQSAFYHPTCSDDGRPHLFFSIFLFSTDSRTLSTHFACFFYICGTQLHLPHFPTSALPRFHTVTRPHTIEQFLCFDLKS